MGMPTCKGSILALLGAAAVCAMLAALLWRPVVAPALVAVRLQLRRWRLAPLSSQLVLFLFVAVATHYAGGKNGATNEPKLTFGVSHSFPGRAEAYDSATGTRFAKTSYPLDSRALWKSFRRGSTPTTGCSCVPQVDYGDGLVVSAATPQGLRSGTCGQSGFPPGVTTRFDYADGGVWAELQYGTNVIWRGWCSHDASPDHEYAYDCRGNRCAATNALGAASTCMILTSRASQVLQAGIGATTAM